MHEAIFNSRTTKYVMKTIHMPPFLNDISNSLQYVFGVSDQLTGLYLLPPKLNDYKHHRFSQALPEVL